MQQPIRILIADDHPIFRHGLISILRNEPEFTVVGEAADGRQALKMIQDVHPDVLLLDQVMPELTGLETLRELSNSPSPVRTILLTAGITKEQIAQALQLGARGIVLKDAPTEVLFNSIRSVMTGQFWVGQNNVADLMQALRAYVPAADDQSKKQFGLTARESDVVGSIVAGLTNREIAENFSISEQTVKHHLRNIFDKLGVSNRLELALFAINHGLVSRD
ncbi:MAG: DNA-binding response regulator [Acidobacteria bacterium]|nr:MAG: DNA-binding response regulator [Acidobacteriota bacterium]